jgi:hypothetical protein
MASQHTHLRQHKHVPGAMYIHANELKRVLGDDYTSKMWMLDRVDDKHFCDYRNKNKSYTMAYRISEQGLSYISKLNLTPTKLTKLGYRDEPVDLNRLKELLSDPKNFKNEQDHLATKIFYSCVDKETGINWVSYRRTTRYGRRFAASPSLQWLPKYIRYQIIHNMTQIDMVNCHPTLIVALAAKLNLPAENLNNYINHRDEMLGQIQTHYGVDRGAAKQLVLMTSYGASLTPKKNNAYATWIQDHGVSVIDAPQWLIGYSDELKKIMTECLQMSWVKQKRLDRVGRATRAFALAIQSIEDELLKVCEQTLSRHNMEINTLMFDGFLIEGKIPSSLVSEMGDEINIYLKNKYDLNCEMKLTSEYYE